ncbi:3-isopropylmalate dehydratase [Mesorhizobium sp. CAU 1732]|uniref:LeuD/DmdB family oxidoreductase small subunit n=1 Tax=Mesorhizobium sp. CAU 1732 TaxID=3140358 RepID=UPI003260E9D2
MNRVFLVGDNIDTDQLAPGQYMRGGIEELARHSLEAVRPDFASSVRPGDVLVGGENFGIGSSREQAAEALRHLGVACVIAQSFAGIFYRNAINLGLPVLVGKDLSHVEDGDPCRFDIDAGELALTAKNTTLRLEPLPENLKQMLSDGGLVPHLKKRFAAKRKDEARQ